MSLIMTTRLLLLALMVLGAESHGYLKSPRSRNYIAWKEGVWSGGTASTYPAESCPHCLNRLGSLGQCGIIDGRSYDANLNVFGQPMAPAIQAQYAQGAEIDVDIVLTAHHKGHFEFFACPIAPGGMGSGNCFQQYPLTFVADLLYGAPKDPNNPTRAYIAPPFRTIYDNTGVAGYFYRFRFQLPSTLTGSIVLLQWHYLTANSCKYPGYSSYPFPSDWGNMNDSLSICGNIPSDGNGTPEQFWNCAEISISSGPITPITAAPIPPPSQPVTSAPYPMQSPYPTSSIPTSGGTCGSGSVGNGVCPDPLLCCSPWGYCGTGSAYCTGNPTMSPLPIPTIAPTISPFTPAPSRAPTIVPISKAPTKAPTTKIPTKVSTTKIPTKASTTKAPTKASTTKIPTKSPTASATSPTGVGTCGNGAVGNGICADTSLCCSPWGWCGTGTIFCAPSPTSAPTTTGTCGNGAIGNGICPNPAQCCSPWGWCSTTPEHCGTSAPTKAPTAI